MVILYGDFMDMNTIPGYEKGRAGNTSDEEMDELKPYWEKFLHGELDLRKRQVKRSEIERFVRIDIRNSVFVENEYTSYAVIRPQSDSYHIMQLCKEADAVFVDVDNGVYITETFDYRSVPPKNLEELKTREIALHNQFINRLSPENRGDLDEKTCKSIIQEELDKIEKWKNKTSQRWFHPTEVEV